MSKNRLYSHIILDRSGSMVTNQEQTISAFNEYVQSLKAQKDIYARVSLTLFDDVSIDLIHDNIKAAKVPELTNRVFIPRGMTPLLDAIGKTVNHIDRADIKPGTKIDLVIITDGYENASREFDKKVIRALLKNRKNKENWLITYLGADQDAWANAQQYGFGVANTMNYTAGEVGAAMQGKLRASVSFASSGNQDDAAFTDDERKAAAGK